MADELVGKLKDSGLQRDASIKPVVVKQKFGELKWQGRHNLCSPFDVLWLSFVSQIRCESVQTCELSGEPGEIHSVGVRDLPLQKGISEMEKEFQEAASSILAA